MDAPRRLMAMAYAASEKVYSFRFDSPMKNSTTKIGVGHFSDVRGGGVVSLPYGTGGEDRTDACRFRTFSRTPIRRH